MKQSYSTNPTHILNLLPSSIVLCFCFRGSFLLHFNRTHSYRPPSTGTSFSTSKLYLQTNRGWEGESGRGADLIMPRTGKRSSGFLHLLVGEPGSLPLLSRGEKSADLAGRRHLRRRSCRRLARLRRRGRRLTLQLVLRHRTRLSPTKSEFQIKQSESRSSSPEKETQSRNLWPERLPAAAARPPET